MSETAPLPTPPTPSPAARALLADVLGMGGLDRSADAWREVLPLLRLHRLEGLALTRFETRAPGRPGVADVLEVLRPEARRTALWTTLVVEAAGRAQTALAGAGLDALVYKGAALVAGGVYPGPGCRAMDDADLLVPAEAADAAVRALEGAGFVPWAPWLPEHADWLDSATFSDPAAPAGLPVSVDLHWRVAYGGLRFGGKDDGGLLWRGPRPAPGLPSHEAHLLVVAEHVLKHLRFRVHMAGFADVVRLAARVEDWDRVVAWGRELRSTRALAALLTVVREEPGAPIPPEVPRALVGGGKVHAPPLLRPSFLAGRVRPVESRAGGLLLRWRLMGTRQAAADVVHAALPGRAWLRARYGKDARTTPGRWLCYLVDVARWVTGRGPSPVSPNQGMDG